MTAVLVILLLVVAAVLLLLPSRRHRIGSGLVDVGYHVQRYASKRLHRASARRTRQRANVREAMAECAAELSAGQPTRRALLRSFDDSLAPRTRAAARFGGDIAAALRADAQEPGREVLASVAACWSVAEGNGAGLAAALDRLVAQERAAQDIRVQLTAHLAAPRASSRMLSLLPLFGLAMGFALGVNPIAWLIGSPVGLACLALGIGLVLLGLWWSSRIVKRVEALL
ncbi:MAG: type II secretion system F family protein [Candidatus Nanopelagicales bacterium]